MKPAFRCTLAASFLAAACGGAWDAFEDHLAGIRKGSLTVLYTDTAKNSLRNQISVPMPETERKPFQSITEKELAATDSDPFSTRLRTNGNLYECETALEAQRLYREFLAEPLNGEKKYMLLHDALYHERRDQYENLDLTFEQSRGLLAFHAHAAIAEWFELIRQHPEDYAGNIDRYTKIEQAFWYATYNQGFSNVDKQNNSGIPWSFSGIKEDLADRALLQQFREFQAYPAVSDPESLEAKRYLQLYYALESLNPIRQDDRLVNGVKQSSTPEFEERLYKITGMTIEQTRSFFTHGKDIAALKTKKEDERLQAIMKEARDKSEQAALSEAQDKLRQCRYQLR